MYLIHEIFIYFFVQGRFLEGPALLHAITHVTCLQCHPNPQSPVSSYQGYNARDRYIIFLWNIILSNYTKFCRTHLRKRGQHCLRKWTITLFEEILVLASCHNSVVFYLPVENIMVWFYIFRLKTEIAIQHFWDTRIQKLRWRN